MKQWEYTVFATDQDWCREVEEELNKQGSEGWELVGETTLSGWTHAFIFKRPKQETHYRGSAT